jgi:hypothetical protein
MKCARKKATRVGRLFHNIAPKAYWDAGPSINRRGRPEVANPATNGAAFTNKEVFSDDDDELSSLSPSSSSCDEPSSW